MNDDDLDPGYAPHFSTIWKYDGLRYGALHLSNPDNPLDIRIIPLDEKQLAVMKRAALAVGTKVAVRRNGVRYEELSPIDRSILLIERSFEITGSSGAHGWAATLKDGPRSGEKVCVDFKQVVNDSVKSALEKAANPKPIIKAPVYEETPGNFISSTPRYIIGMYLG